jgi:ABC-type Fe3+/spermidine/putrescine transport system ATPase subunit
VIDIRLEGLTRRYGDVVALDELTLDIGGGTVTALLGPSGCGKTTALKLIAGLLDPSAGRVRFAGRDVTEVPAERHGAVMVFQDHRLFPYLSAADNVAFGLRMRGVPRQERRRRAFALLERVGLEGLGDRRPAELSGGQQQRVALARALVLQPDVLLLDEPLANLDAHLREGMRELILDVQRERELTTVVVTHDQEEAVVLAEDIGLLFDGRLHQHGAPRTFFEHPATERTARFFGATNIVPGRRHGDLVHGPLGRLRVVEGAPGGPDVWVTIRPERISVGAAAAVHDHRVEGRVISSAFLGTRTRAVVEVAGIRLTVDVADDALADVGPGSVLTLVLPHDALWTVPRDTTEATAPSPGSDHGAPSVAGTPGDDGSLYPHPDQGPRR